MKLLLNRKVNSHIANEDGATGLQLAVKTESDEASVPLLVKNKVDVNIRNIRTGDTALHLAIEWRRQRIILYLLDRGASIEMANEDGFTPLQLAVKFDNCDAISVLLQRCAPVEARSLSGFTALQLAAHEKHWVAFDLLIIGGADINAWNKDGEALIHEQARKATSPSVAAKLLEQGANIEAITAQGYTPLLCAAAAGNKEMFVFLLERGAKIDVLTTTGESILHITPPVNDNCLDILKFALEYNESQNIDMEIAVNAASNKGWTPLHQAVYVGTGAPDTAFDKTSEYIHLLLEHGADVNARLCSLTAETPLHLAAMAIVPRPSLVLLLLEAGAETNALTGEGKSALHLAAERGRESIFRILYEGGADMALEAPDSARADDGYGAGNTAFDLALKNPFGRLWFGVDGELCPSTTDFSRRQSISTVIDEDLNTEGAFDEDDDADEELEDEEDEEEREKGVGALLERNETPYIIV
ncbi:hypothetical protein ARAM_006285 [Aspergillus rambellii]|uniref:Uncharacterized protein n=1 Tax=Aspergillus rambellii TaxID=308745 RepID=A0A0F8WY30_9EURO|nr:hypothetical protein ARAM_006285 [Aspergillus rambellii]